MLGPGHPAYSVGSSFTKLMMPAPRPLLLPLLLVATLGGCSMGGGTKSTPTAYEAFDSSNTYSRSYDHSPAQACEAAGIAFIGPRHEVLELTGNKARAIAAARP